MSEYPVTVQSCPYTRSQTERFWSRVNIGSPEDCWEWQEGCHKRYGWIHLSNRRRYSHRVAYEIAVGPIAPYPLVMHLCDNPPCCNPAHLRPGTWQDNMDDMWRKGRGSDGDNHWARRHPEKVRRGDESPSRVYIQHRPRGDNHYARVHPERLARGDRSGSRLHPESRPKGTTMYNAALTADEVRLARKMYSDGSRQVDIAERLGTSKYVVSDVVRRKTYREIE